MAQFRLLIIFFCSPMVLVAVASCTPYYNDDTGYEAADRDRRGSDTRIYPRNVPIYWNERRVARLPDTATPVALPPHLPAASPAPAPRIAIAKPPLLSPPSENPVPDPRAGASDPFSVTGLSEREIESMLGRPDKKSDQGPRRIWTYEQPHCSLRVTLFLDITRNGYYALDQKIVAPDGGTTSGRECVRDVRNARSD